MRFLKGVTTLAASCLFGITSPLYAEVSTTLQFFGALGPDQTFEKNDARIVSDSKVRDDATARARADASADIGTGELEAKAIGRKFIFGETEIAARAIARAADTLTIEGPGTEPIPVTFQMAVQGDLVVPDSATGAGTAFATVQGVLGVGGGSETATLQRRRVYDAVGAIASNTLFGVGDWQGELPVTVSPDHFELLLQFDTTAVPGAPFEFESELRALVGTIGAVGSDAISDFGNTATFTIILPQSYTFTSASGVFLAGPVPEPEISAMFVCGLAGLWIAVMRGRRAMQMT